MPTTGFCMNPPVCAHVYIPATYWRHSCAGGTGSCGEAPSSPQLYFSGSQIEITINMAKGFPKSMVYIVAHGDLCDSGVHTEPDLPWFRLHVPPPSNRVSLNILEPFMCVPRANG